MKKLMMISLAAVAVAQFGCCPDGAAVANRDSDKTITINGVGSVSVAPDYVELSLGVEGKALQYKNALEKANKLVVLLQKAVVKLGFKESDLKTSSFDIRENRRYDNKTEKYVFDGYSCSYNFKLGFDFTMEKLSDVVTQLSKCGADPKLSISFTVKDKTAIAKEVLVSATKDAQRKAEILVDSANAKLCELVSIDYSCAEVSVISTTRFGRNSGDVAMLCEAPAIEIVPEDIRVKDTATFVWRIESK